MESRGGFPPNVALTEALDFYFQLCSVELNIEQMGFIAATYANYGICPLTGEKTMTMDTVKKTLQLLYSCGMYDYSGEWAMTVGLPAKSGVSGNLFFVVPNKLGMAVYSPPLDSRGNSVKGVEYSKRVAELFGWSLFDVLYQARDVR